MLINKKTLLFCPKKGYLLFDPSTCLYSTFEEGSDEPGKEEDLKIFSGPVKFYNTLVDLNDALSKVDIGKVESAIHLYKGHLFPANSFPLELKNGYTNTFVIEKIDTSICFVEEMPSLKDATESIESELSTLKKKKEINTKDSNSITDYLVFVGNSKHPVFRCVDSEI